MLQFSLNFIIFFTFQFDLFSLKRKSPYVILRKTPEEKECIEVKLGIIGAMEEEVAQLKEWNFLTAFCLAKQ